MGIYYNFYLVYKVEAGDTHIYISRIDEADSRFPEAYVMKKINYDDLEKYRLLSDCTISLTKDEQATLDHALESFGTDCQHGWYLTYNFESTHEY